MPLNLTTEDRALLSGSDGEATSLAMRILVSAAELLGAQSLVQITSAHIDGCLYHGDGGVEFAENLVASGGQVAVPTTLNVGALDLLHPDSVRVDQSKTSMARRQMDAYVSMGAQPTFTCAPYQIGHEPGVGEQVAWGESNAIAFANSVLGARTERYGDFLDACCALTGRAPLHGLHIAKNREAKVIVDVTAVPDALRNRDVFYPVLGTWLGLEIGREVPLIVGLPSTVTRDQLKALGASAASTGAVALFHVLGVTPEAPTLDAVISKSGPVRRITLEPGMLKRALGRLTTANAAEQIDAIAIGSPHFSIAEFEALLKLVRGRCMVVPFYACTARDTLRELERRGDLRVLQEAGVEIIADTCVVVTPILPEDGSVLMTNSGKFAHYGPSNTGYDVVYGSLEDCVESAVTGSVVRTEGIWSW
ncbi:MAG: aconitase X catalytic domain-containing protein [Longimicrobiales bacterium]|nr:aconitase X catalytic domain-containing protein [Longimicrobiales bacterium]